MRDIIIIVHKKSRKQTFLQIGSAQGKCFLSLRSEGLLKNNTAKGCQPAVGCLRAFSLMCKPLEYFSTDKLKA